MPLLRQLASENPIKGYLTLAEFINPITFALKLVNGGALYAESCDIDLEIAAEVYGYYHVEESALPFRDCARISASSVQLATRNKTNNSYCLSAEEVKLGTEYKFFLKRANLRELVTYLRMEDAQNFPHDIRIPCIVGLVEANDESIVGVLFALIDRKYELKNELDDPNNKITLAQKKNWLDQVKYIVSKLHMAGIPWGDVSPDNIMIDMKDCAWVVDFTVGGLTGEFLIGEGNFSRLESDLEGLKILTIYMGVKEN